MKVSPELEAAILATPGVVVKHGAPLPSHTPKPIVETVDEKAFQSEVVKLAKRNGWLVFHPWLSIKSTAGWPDLAMAKAVGDKGRLILAELKTETGTLSAPQLDWAEVLELVAGIEYFIWRPSNWERIMEVLAG